MENKIKIIVFVAFIVLSCSRENNNSHQQQNTNDIQVENLESVYQGYFSNGYIGKIVYQDEQMCFKVKYSHCIKIGEEFITAKLTTIDGHIIDIKEIVDTTTFRIVGLSVEEKNSINNAYYLGGRMNCYYKDKNNLYAFLDNENPEYLILGSWKDVSLLGGNYLKIKHRIYSKGIHIPQADVATFHTLNIGQFHRKSEWSITVGLDENYIYFNEKIMDFKMFKDVIGTNDSLKQIYFKGTEN